MNNSTTINISNTANKNLKLLFYIAIVLSVIIPIYYAIDKLIDIPMDIPVDYTTDIDWKKPPCNPNEFK